MFHLFSIRNYRNLYVNGKQRKCRAGFATALSSEISTNRAETKALIGGGAYSYIRVLPDEFLLKSVVITVDFKRNSSGRTRIYEYAPPPPPPINALVSALSTKLRGLAATLFARPKMASKIIYRLPPYNFFTNTTVLTTRRKMVKKLRN